jgi:hypothetical protein
MVIKINIPTTNILALVDLEFDTQSDSSYQFAAIKLRKIDSQNNLFQVVESINAYCKDEEDSFLQNKGLSRCEYHNQVKNFLKDVDTIAAHNLRMDNHFIAAITNKSFKKICTYQLAKRVLGRNNNLSLPIIAKECMYSLPEFEQHNAYNDVRALLWVISYLTNKTKGDNYEIFKYTE